MFDSFKGATGLAKAATGFAVLLIVSLGLCGANAALLSRFGAIGGGPLPPGRSETLSGILIMASFAEAGGILIGAAGLVVAGIIAIARLIFRRIRARHE